MNASDTNLQMNGRVHGKGIYLSPMSSTSFGYSRMAQCAPSIGPARHGATRGAPAIVCIYFDVSMQLRVNFLKQDILTSKRGTKLFHSNREEMVALFCS